MLRLNAEKKLQLMVIANRGRHQPLGIWNLFCKQLVLGMLFFLS